MITQVVDFTLFIVALSLTLHYAGWSADWCRSCNRLCRWHCRLPVERFLKRCRLMPRVGLHRNAFLLGTERPTGAPYRTLWESWRRVWNWKSSSLWCLVPGMNGNVIRRSILPTYWLREHCLMMHTPTVSGRHHWHTGLEAHVRQTKRIWRHTRRAFKS